MSQWAHVYEMAQHDGLAEAEKMKGQWSKSVFSNDKPLVLELGCGKGEYTVALAELYPEKNFIGIDIKGARMWTGAKAVADKGLKNAVFLRTHIEFLDSFFEAGEIAEIWLTFPDPQMKKIRKRLTSTRFMPVYAKLLRAGGSVHLKTDSLFMHRYTMEMIRSNRLSVLRETEDLYSGDWVDPILGIQTFYEKQWLQRGLRIKYVHFVPKQDGDWVEPDVEIEPDPYRSFGRSARNLETNVSTQIRE